ncbi:curved DNA-binding protein Cdb4 [Schizosaccharomyces cryophilus OY26]|uniref:Curved DNA-binding protein Cdb4 n=1 Tax=Schizosaccharomyces cryophilus (strain OY26 / ATCC MYA-4695 / CBS 11777 / NBRC 106824 / NRRL Y48691) TaxID=653667 RepID=S9VXS9_SCHCR|nr:curved DNA-binding protein Cdb4 [Schizosaccharomyces cryophilus OY26]EPY51019.1 curved DNA-binding protein Cdb4 [Schizosaccharomyces cryophilus OY26]
MATKEVKQETAVDYSLNNSETINKYKLAGELSQNVLNKVVDLCKDGAKVFDICVRGDQLLEEAVSKVARGKDSYKGIAFPTAVSPNGVAAHLSPLSNDPEANIILKAGDIVKVFLGAHIDGFASLVATTVVVSEEAVIGEKADVIAAASAALKAAQRTIKPGNNNWQVTDIVDKIATTYGCKPVSGMLTHQQERDVIDGKKQIILNPSETQRAQFDTFTFQEGEVYGVDILISSSPSGKIKRSDIATRIYKKTDTKYMLKLQASRKVYSEIQNKFGAYPFSTRNITHDSRTNMGFSECTQHDLLYPYDVLTDKEGGYIAEFYSTIALTKNGTIVFSDSEPRNNIQSDKKIEDKEIISLLETPLKTSSASKKKKNNKKKTTGEGQAA